LLPDISNLPRKSKHLGRRLPNGHTTALEKERRISPRKRRPWRKRTAPFHNSVWERVHLLTSPGGVSQGFYLSRTGQEVAPWHLGQVAVASKGLFPQPLWIKAAVMATHQFLAEGQNHVKRNLSRELLIFCVFTSL
jgi:hypothetical protein